MGQVTMGILWGVRVPGRVVLHDDDSNDAVLDLWDQECAGLIAAHDAAVTAWVRARPGRMPYQRISGARRYVPDWPSGTSMVGFWIAAGAGGKGGIPVLGAWQSPGYTPVELTRAGVREAFPVAYRNARIRWHRFRAWASEHPDINGCSHFAATEPSLWLVPTEVA